MHLGDRTEAMQVAQISVFVQQIEEASKIT